MQIRSLITIVTIYLILTITFATAYPCGEGEVVKAENTETIDVVETEITSEVYEADIAEYAVTISEESIESKTEDYEEYTSTETTEVESETETSTAEETTEQETEETTSSVSYTYTDYEIDVLARCVMAEAGNQDLMGKRMVVDVILNRVRDNDWPNNIVSVITQKYQFSSYWNGSMDTVTPTEECYTAIYLELEEISYPGLYYFTAGHYGDYGTPWGIHGDHYFCTK